MIASRQRGATLFIALILLVVLTVLALSSYNLSSLNQKVVGNAQFRAEMEARAIQPVELVINDYTKFLTPPTSVTTLTSGQVTVAVTGPVCQSRTPSLGESQVITSESGAPTPGGGGTSGGGSQYFDTHWRVAATATHSVTGGTATLTEGVKIKANDLDCP